MKPKKQRLHSAELRRLDHIAQSLDRIAAALERRPGFVVSGNDDTIIDTMDVKAGEKTQIALHTISNDTDIEHSQNVLLNSSGNDISMNAQRGGKNNRLASHDINDIKQDGGGNAAFGNVRSIRQTQTGDGIQQHSEQDANANNSDSFNNNSNEAIKNLTTALKQ